MALADYLASRREEIERQIKALKAELGEIRIAEGALAGVPGARTAMTGNKGSAVVRVGSIKDWILKALTQFPPGLDTDNVIIAVSGIGGPTVSRSSITPQLSRLKAAGLIEQEGRFWQLPSKEATQNDETPGGQTPSVPSEEDPNDPFSGL